MTSLALISAANPSRVAIAVFFSRALISILHRKKGSGGGRRGGEGKKKTTRIQWKEDVVKRWTKPRDEMVCTAFKRKKKEKKTKGGY